MSSATLNPLRLLMSRSNVSQAFVTRTLPASVTARSFSSSKGDDEGSPLHPRFRRPEGGGRGRGGGGGGGERRRPSRNQKSSYDYGGSFELSQPKQSWFRNNTIDLFPGNYEDQPGEETDPFEEDEAEEYDEFDEETLAKLYRDDQDYEAKKERWIQNSMPPVRVPVIDFAGRSYGRGARKRGQARVWITPGFGNVTVNRKDFLDYFPRRSDREMILDPLVVTKTAGLFDLQCQVKGGGLTGQAGAIRLGVARALQNWNPEYRPYMKAAGYLTRDARKVERKKIGHVKARKKPQWNRR